MNCRFGSIAGEAFVWQGFDGVATGVGVVDLAGARAVLRAPDRRAGAAVERDQVPGARRDEDEIDDAARRTDALQLDRGAVRIARQADLEEALEPMHIRGGDGRSPAHCCRCVGVAIELQPVVCRDGGGHQRADERDDDRQRAPNSVRVQVDTIDMPPRSIAARDPAHSSHLFCRAVESVIVQFARQDNVANDAERASGEASRNA